MFWEKLLTFLKGFVEFRATGGFPERFINLCGANSVPVQNVKMFGETITGVCGIKDYSAIRKISKKSGMKVRIVRKKGLPFFIHKNRKRTGIIIGFALMIIITALLSERIWVINVSGNEKVPAEEILSAFEEMGIKTGIKRDSINAKEKAHEALVKSDDFMWCAVNIDGCKISIEVKERVEKEIEETDDAPSNIVASKSGQIKVIECFTGTPVTEVGSAVEKGDIIVSGAVINKDESVSFYKADANVIARTKNIVTSEMKTNQKMRVYTKVKNKYYLTFFSLHFPVNFIIGKDENFSFSAGENFLSSSKGKLPVGVSFERYACFERRNLSLDKNVCTLMCCEKYLRRIDENFDDIETESMSSEITKDKNCVTISSVFQCVENIAESEKMDLHTDESFNTAQ